MIKIVSSQDREELVAARGAEYRAGEMTEAQFRAYLFGMKCRGEDIRQRLAEFAPSPSPPSFEDRRMEASREWMAGYLSRKAAT